jgi:hypothetical protein
MSRVDFQAELAAALVAGTAFEDDGDPDPVHEPVNKRRKSANPSLKRAL